MWNLMNGTVFFFFFVFFYLLINAKHTSNGKTELLDI